MTSSLQQVLHHVITVINPKWLWIAAGSSGGIWNSTRVRYKVNKRGGKQSPQTNLIILTHCNTTKNILERFYCLLRLFRGKSRLRALFGVFFVKQACSKNVSKLFTLVWKISTFGKCILFELMWQRVEEEEEEVEEGAAALDGLFPAASHGSQQQWASFHKIGGDVGL